MAKKKKSNRYGHGSKFLATKRNSGKGGAAKPGIMKMPKNSKGD